MELFVPMVALAALVMKFVTVSKFITAKDWPSAITQFYTWAAGVIAVLLFAKTNYAADIDFGSQTLATLNFWSQFVIGLGIASTASVGYDAIHPPTPPLIPVS